MTIQKVLKNVEKIKVIYDDEGNIDERELCDSIVSSFEDYEYDDESDLIISEDESNSNIDYQAYVDVEDSPIICIKIVGNALDAWIY